MAFPTTTLPATRPAGAGTSPSSNAVDPRLQFQEVHNSAQTAMQALDDATAGLNQILTTLAQMDDQDRKLTGKVGSVREQMRQLQAQRAGLDPNDKDLAAKQAALDGQLGGLNTLLSSLTLQQTALHDMKSQAADMRDQAQDAVAAASRALPAAQAEDARANAADRERSERDATEARNAAEEARELDDTSRQTSREQGRAALTSRSQPPGSLLPGPDDEPGRRRGGRTGGSGGAVSGSGGSTA